MLLGHDLFALDLAILEAIAAGVRTLGPLAHLPTHRTVQDIAVLPVGGRRLGAHAIGHHHGVLPTASNLMDALHLSGLDADAAALGTGRVIGVVPPRGAGSVVASAHPGLRLGFGGTEEGRHHPAIILSHAVDNQLLHAAQTGGTARGVALLPPHVRLSRL